MGAPDNSIVKVVDDGIQEIEAEPIVRFTVMPGDLLSENDFPFLVVPVCRKIANSKRRLPHVASVFTDASSESLPDIHSTIRVVTGFLSLLLHK
jgi:hypothetical protein